jgi:hypothetical protein
MLFYLLWFFAALGCGIYPEYTTISLYHNAPYLIVTTRVCLSLQLLAFTQRPARFRKLPFKVVLDWQLP